VASSSAWQWHEKILFRFSFVYLGVFLLTSVPVLSGPFGTVVHWLAAPLYVLLFGGSDGMPAAQGSVGNSSVQALGGLLLAVLATPLWCLLQWPSRWDDRLHQWLRWSARYFVMLVMLIYGVAKGVQFGEPTVSQMLQPIGSLTPMGALWLFMGTSKAYSLFAGVAEVTGALLLLGRRTITLGALIVLGVMTNVWLMNVLYDVPVKTLSFHLMLLAAFLIAPDARRLRDFFLLNRATQPQPLAPLLPSLNWRRVGLVLQGLVVVGTVAFTGVFLSLAWKPRQASPLAGVWFVEEYATSGTLRPPLVTDETRWRRIVFDFPQTMAVQRMDDAVERYSVQLDLEKKSLTLRKPGDSSWRAEFAVERTSEDALALAGTFAGQPVQAKLKRLPPKDFPLARNHFR